jgi:hypothetical protein
VTGPPIYNPRAVLQMALLSLFGALFIAAALVFLVVKWLD